MDRREALSVVTMIFGGAVIGAGSFLSGCNTNDRKSIFGMLDKQQINTFEEVAETILPKTKNSPGAKDVEIGKFANGYVSDCYDNLAQKTLVDGIVKLDELSNVTFDDNFADLKTEYKHELLLKLETKSRAHRQNSKVGSQTHYYAMMKQLTILGYLTSEKVGTEVLNHVPIPGRFEGCIPYANGEKAMI